MMIKSKVYGMNCTSPIIYNKNILALSTPSHKIFKINIETN